MLVGRERVRLWKMAGGTQRPSASRGLLHFCPGRRRQHLFLQSDVRLCVSLWAGNLVHCMLCDGRSHGSVNSLEADICVVAYWVDDNFIVVAFLREFI